MILSSYTLTGEHKPQFEIRAGNLVPNTPSIGGDSEYYTRPYATTAEPVMGFRKGRLRREPGEIETGARVADRRLFRLLLEKASECAGRLEAASEEEYMERGTAGNELLGYLEELWLLRGLCEREWQTLLAFIQSSLFKAVFEKFTPLQCECVRSLVVDYLPDSALTKDRVASAMRLMRESKLDVWRGLSESDDPQE